jgi:dihydroorotate dehydrogenase (NAD+) catalytic subunit
MKPDLWVEIAGIKFANPVLTASGTFGYGEEYAPYLDLGLLGGIVTKGISLKPRPGNPGMRTVETPAGMLNAIGLQNVGVEAFLTDKMPFLRKLGIPVIVNILGDTVEDYGTLAEILGSEEGVAALEVNISCPNVAKGGMAFGQDPEAAFRVISRVKKASKVPVIPKLSPQVTDIRLIARAAEEAGADAVSLTNTFPAMVINVETRKPVLGPGIGGLSGPAIRPLAVRLVWEVARTAKIPVIGIGGITSASDALEFIIAGAWAVQVGTANFVNPRVTLEIIEGIGRYLIEQKISKLAQIRGTLKI